MTEIRTVKQIFPGQPVIEGAGVHLKRAFGRNEVPLLDPFLLLDDFHSDNPEDYIKGFPWHPHRGIETITYVLHGEVEHGDSMGNRGVIRSGDVQWMTAGSGIIHQEMPKGRADGLMWGFQLWANLPASEKMMEARYRGVESGQIPEVSLESGAKIKIICGIIEGVTGPVTDIITRPEYLDVTLDKNSSFSHAVKLGRNAFAYVIEGEGCFDNGGERVPAEHVVHFSDGDEVLITAKEAPVRFLLVSGQPIGEPVAWYGPIVMNTEEELRTAFEEYENGTFLKHRKS